MLGHWAGTAQPDREETWSGRSRIDWWSVLVFPGCCNKLPPNQVLRMARVSYLTVLRAKGVEISFTRLKWRCPQGEFLLAALREDFLSFSSFSICIPWLPPLS